MDSQRSLAPRSHAALVAAGTLCVAHISSFDIRTTPLITDIRYFVYFSWRIASGDVPHLDYFGNKTQLSSFFGALVMRVADWIGADSLMAVRASYLCLAALSGLLSFFIFRQLAEGRSIPGLLGVLSYCSFPLLGLLPAIGVLPKMIVAVMASVSMLCIYHRKWFLAGICSALAFMDWQAGGLVGVAALVAAGCFGRSRLRAAMKVVAGGVAGIGPFVLYYAHHGVLGQAVHEVLVMTLYRGTTSLAKWTLADRLGSIDMLAERFGAALPGLFYLAAIGIPIALFWLWVRRDRDSTRLLLPLVIYHLGIMAFSALDFSLFGDFFILLHSVVFFLGIVWVALYERLLEVFPGQRNGRRVAIAALVGATLLARPSFLRPEMVVRARTANVATVLADQREVAAQVDRVMSGKRVAYLHNIEIAYLLHYVNPLPSIYWNSASWRNFRQPGEESSAVTAARLVESLEPNAYVADSRLRLGEHLDGYQARAFVSENGNYSVTLHVAIRDQSP